MMQRLLLRRYDFPGNVRELENILERAYTLCDADIIHASDLHLGEEKDETSLIPDASVIDIPEGVTELDSLSGVSRAWHYHARAGIQSLEQDGYCAKTGNFISAVALPFEKSWVWMIKVCLVKITTKME
jgi:DNA-binding NtrC family response regulator